MEKDVEIGIFGGTGIYDSGLLENAQEIDIDTPYGKPSDTITVGVFKGRKIAFLPRHGKKHAIPPQFSAIQTIFFERDGKKMESIEDYVVVEDYLHAVNQTYEIKLRQEGYSNLTPESIDSKDSNGILEKLRRVWQEHSEDDWGEFNNEEITRYICEKITLEETNFLSDKTKDQFRSLYRLIAERIRQYQNTATKPDLEKFQKKKE